MADTLPRFTRSFKQFFTQYFNLLTQGQRGIDDFLFSTRDEDANSANFAIDRLVVNPYGVSFRRPNEQAAIRAYSPGTGMIYETPHSSEATPITELMRDAIVAGGEFFDNFMSREQNLMRNIMNEHIVAHTITRWKLAIDTMLTGKFTPWGLKGADIKLEIDYSRDASLTDTYDFTAVGANIDKALKQAYDKMVPFGGMVGMAVLMGSSWLQKFETDANVLEQRKAYGGNSLLQSNLIPPSMLNVYGLYVVATYRVPGIPIPFFILAFSPEGNFVKYRAATAEPYVPNTKMCMFSVGGARYKVLRGIDVRNDSGQVVRASGDIVFDNYTENNPVATFLRSNARYAFVPGNVNNTYVSTGTF